MTTQAMARENSAQTETRAAARATAASRRSVHHAGLGHALATDHNNRTLEALGEAIEAV
jgi:hypothetical protein